jgi:hypothetical protein
MVLHQSVEAVNLSLDTGGGVRDHAKSNLNLDMKRVDTPAHPIRGRKVTLLQLP